MILETKLALGALGVLVLSRRSKSSGGGAGGGANPQNTPGREAGRSYTGDATISNRVAAQGSTYTADGGSPGVTGAGAVTGSVGGLGDFLGAVASVASSIAGPLGKGVSMVAGFASSQAKSSVAAGAVAVGTESARQGALEGFRSSEISDQNVTASLAAFSDINDSNIEAAQQALSDNESINSLSQNDMSDISFEGDNSGSSSSSDGGVGFGGGDAGPGNGGGGSDANGGGGY